MIEEKGCDEGGDEEEKQGSEEGGRGGTMARPMTQYTRATFR